MAENAPQHEPKLSDADVIIGSILMLTLDAIDWLQLGIPGTDLVGFPLEQLFLNKKGVKGTTALVGNLIELIPGVDYLPVRSIAWIITAWMDRHPSEFSEKVEQVGEVVQKAEGKAGAGALQAESAAAKEAATVAEQSAAQGAAGAVEKSAESGASTAAGAAEKSAQDKIAASEQGSGSVRDRSGEASGGDQGSEEKEGGEEEAKPLTLEQQREENAIKGLDIEDLALDVFSPEEIMSDIGAPTLGTKASKFDPDKAIEPKAAKQWPTQSNMNRKGIIDSERVDLKNAEKPKTREFLEDAA